MSTGRKIRVGINGFGRIGRLVLRSAYRGIKNDFNMIIII